MRGIQVRYRIDDGDWSGWIWLGTEISTQTPGNYVHYEFRWWHVYKPSFYLDDDE